ncbi:hypothetical protein MHU86_6753 [Fragilaria crotonensis]|nr:hypothetical protein MHU86_6753 [Fragilaria crotonensis]
MAYVIFARQPILQQDLRLWNRRPVVERTWTNVLNHFRDAQSDLSSLPNAGDIFHQQQPPHQANYVATMADLVAQRLLDALPTDDHPLVPPPASDVANVAFQQRDSALLAQMTEMMSIMRTGLPNATNHQRHHPRNTRSARHGRVTNRSGGRGRNTAPAARAYCWSHGACAHPSSECNNQLPGHQTSATFANMHHGGNTSNCFWLPTS